MAKTIFVRPAKPQDREVFIDWTVSTEDNIADLDVITYPSTYVRCAFNSNGPVAYLPIQRPLMLEGLASNPEADKIDVAMALKELVQDTVSQAYIQGSGEIYFLCGSESTKKFALAHGFEEIKLSVFRMKLSSLEKKDESTLEPKTE